MGEYGPGLWDQPLNQLFGIMSIHSVLTFYQFVSLDNRIQSDIHFLLFIYASRAEHATCYQRFG